jgi:hypothetical protein
VSHIKNSALLYSELQHGFVLSEEIERSTIGEVRRRLMDVVEKHLQTENSPKNENIHEDVQQIAW